MNNADSLRQSISPANWNSRICTYTLFRAHLCRPLCDLRFYYSDTGSTALCVGSEIAHTTVGRAICGTWSPRKLNSWQVACQERRPELIFVPIAGLALSYGLM